jgi:hypothetical protein
MPKPAFALSRFVKTLVLGRVVRLARRVPSHDSGIAPVWSASSPRGLAVVSTWR